MQSALTVDDFLAQARRQGLDRLDAQLLLAHHLGRSRAWVMAHGEALLAPHQAEALSRQFTQRAGGVPLAYLLGEREFHGLRLVITPAVLVPRPDTETLVAWAIDVLNGPLATRATPRVLDLGTGSGAIALAIRQACPRAEVSAVDRSAEALAVAQANGERLQLPVRWLQGDWFAAVGAEERFDLVVSNPPYIDAADPHLPALHAEPREALTPGPDGLADLRAIVRAAPDHLIPGGALLLEHGHEQAAAVREGLMDAGFRDIATRVDLGSRDRCSGGFHPGRAVR